MEKEKSTVKKTLGELTEIIYNAPAGKEINFSANEDMSEYWGAKRFDVFDNSIILIGYYGGPDCQIFNEATDKRKEITSHLRYCLGIDDRDENPVVYMYQSQNTEIQPFFIHEESGFKIHAPLDTTILKYSDSYFAKITTLLEILQETPDYQKLKDYIPEKAWENKYHSFWDEADALAFFMIDISIEIDYYIPEGYFFGSHPGEGNECGFWKK